MQYVLHVTHTSTSPPRVANVCLLYRMQSSYANINVNGTFIHSAFMHIPYVWMYVYVYHVPYTRMYNQHMRVYITVTNTLPQVMIPKDPRVTPRGYDDYHVYNTCTIINGYITYVMYAIHCIRSIRNALYCIRSIHNNKKKMQYNMYNMLL